MGLREIKIGDVPFFFRPNTSDETILSVTFSQNPLEREYIFPNDIKDVNTIFDIGANIGVTAIVLNDLYPNAIIHAFEPEKENFEILLKNTQSKKNIICHNIGLSAMTCNMDLLKSDDPINFGGYSVHEIGSGGFSQQIKCVSMYDFLNKHGLTHADFIKIDCEGAENAILGDIDLSKTKWIEGEMHGFNEFKLLDHLSKNFELQFQKKFGQRMWHFRALNKNISLL